jgi:integrase
MGEAEVVEFLSSLATVGEVSASTQNQALGALVFLYGEVLGRPLDWLAGIVRAKRPVRVPTVLTREEVSSLLSRLTGSVWLMSALMYGAGLRLMEVCELRVKDLDLAGREIRVRDGKGRKDRVTALPTRMAEALVNTWPRYARSTNATWRRAPGGWRCQTH